MPEARATQPDDGYDPWRGQLLGDRYRVLGHIGSGGASHVYVAEHVHLARRFAVKIMHDSRLGDPVALQRFMNEGKVAGRLGHPNIVEWTDMGFTKDGVPYLVMELLEGKNLEEELLASGPFSLERMVKIGAQIASALAAVHGVGIIHRDLKTSNVFLLPGDQVKVLDFGISKILGAAGPNITHRTRVVGTPQYMAPEQLLAPQSIGERTDVYALGVILYELASGHTPYAGLSVSKCLELIVTAPPPSLQAQRPDLPISFVRLVESALAKDPRDRPENMSVLRGAIEGLAKAKARPTPPRGLPVETSSPPPAPRVPSPLPLSSSLTPQFVEPPPALLAAVPPAREPSAGVSSAVSTDPSTPRSTQSSTQRSTEVRSPPATPRPASLGAPDATPVDARLATPSPLAPAIAPSVASLPSTSLEASPVFEPSPAFEPSPVFEPSPALEPSPAFEPRPVFEPSPATEVKSARPARREWAGAPRTRVLLLLLLLAAAVLALAASRAALVDDVPRRPPSRTVTP